MTRLDEIKARLAALDGATPSAALIRLQRHAPDDLALLVEAVERLLASTGWQHRHTMHPDADPCRACLDLAWLRERGLVAGGAAEEDGR